ncbi:MAG TPA: hypothetical protein VI451_06875, partial [Anaerolineales bacterium]|nr:hypothetical protein [Anaerolineales bacterium]
PITIGERRYTGRLLGGETGKLIRSRYSGTFKNYEPVDCFKNSLEIFTELGINRERAFTLREWARYEFNKGQKDTAEKYWIEAREIFSSLGLEKELEQMDDAISSSSPAYKDHS